MSKEATSSQILEYENAEKNAAFLKNMPEYRLLAKYNDVILAVAFCEKSNEYHYTTWNIGYIADSICNGHYFLTDYKGAKRDFAVRSDLVLETEVKTLLNEKSEDIRVDGHWGTWYVIDTATYGGQTYYLLEHETYGDEAACVIVNAYGDKVYDEVYNGFSDYEYCLETDIQQRQDNTPNDEVEQ